MFTQFSVAGFRGLGNLTLGSVQYPLPRVNLIGGMNNSGKTSVLEAIYVHLGATNPEAVLNLNLFRGVDPSDADAVSQWGWMFQNREIGRDIELESESDDDVGRRTVTMRLAPVTSGVVGVGSGHGSGHGTGSPPSGVFSIPDIPRDLVLEYQDARGQGGAVRVSAHQLQDVAEKRRGDVEFRAQFAAGEFAQPASRAVLLSARAHILQQNADWLSDLERDAKQDEVVAVLRRLDPRLKRLTILTSGGVPLIHCDVGIGTAVPVPYMGEGFLRLLTIVLGATATENGWLLIDEVENGIHYSALSMIWEAVAEVAERRNVQIFATTHSFECIGAAHQAFEKRTVEQGKHYELALHRLERGESGDVQVISYTEKTLDTSLELGWEIR